MPFNFSKINFKKMIRREKGEKEPKRRPEKVSPREAAFRKAFKKREASEKRRKKDKTLK
jgi:hypothetical protein